MENTTLTSNNLITDKSFNGTIWRPLNSDLNDELVFEIKKTKIEDYKKMIIQEMETALEPIFKISVPLSVDSNYADNWNEAH